MRRPTAVRGRFSHTPNSLRNHLRPLGCTTRATMGALATEAGAGCMAMAGTVVSTAASVSWLHDINTATIATEMMSA